MIKVVLPYIRYVNHDENDKDNLIHYVNDEYKVFTLRLDEKAAERRGIESRGFFVHKRNFAQEIKKRKFAQNKKEEVFRI